jgi:hypothetical protein
MKATEQQIAAAIIAAEDAGKAYVRTVVHPRCVVVRCHQPAPNFVSAMTVDASAVVHHWEFTTEDEAKAFQRFKIMEAALTAALSVT